MQIYKYQHFNSGIQPYWWLVQITNYNLNKKGLEYPIIDQKISTEFLGNIIYKKID